MGSKVLPAAARVRVVELGTGPAPEEAFRVLAGREGVFFLDSASGLRAGWGAPLRGSEGAGPWSFLGAEPYAVIEAHERRIVEREGMLERCYEGDPFAALRARLARLGRTGRDPALPFEGGAVGFLGYDLKHCVERVSRLARRDQRFPDMRMAFHDWVLACDLSRRRWYASVAPEPGSGRDAGSLLDRARAVLDEAAGLPPPAPARDAEAPPEGSVELPASNMTREEYLRAVRRILDYISAGDIYQANFTRRFEAAVRRPSGELYLALRRRNPAPFAAYLDAGDGLAVMSSSPELFLRLRGRRAETRPIKGTRPRGRTEEEDRALAGELLSSAKDAAELAMITDLERNDLGRVSEYGSVHVTEAAALEAYATVFHLVATVSARLADGEDAVSLARAAFPGGSITGAPKIRAMEIIDELEPTARSVYTGAIGFFDSSGDMDLNIAIRTMLFDRGRVTYQVGGGIVADSDPEAEHEECLAKGRALAEVLASCVPGGGGDP